MIHHVTLETRPEQVEACIAFYALLGFAEVPAPETLGGRARWLERRGTHVHLLETEDQATSRGGHFAVVCPDYASTLEALRAAGHRLAPRQRHWDAARAFVRDPAGNVVEVMEAPPPS